MSWRNPGAGVPLFLHIAAGVFLGLLAAAFVIWRVSIWQLQASAVAAQEALQRAQTQATQAVREAQQAAAQREAAQRAHSAATQRADEALRQHTQQEAARREAAWAAFYRKPAACDDTRGGSWTVECANEFMRAKQRFATLYDAGKL